MNCFEQVIEVEQKIIIRNSNLLFQFSDHNNNLLVLKLWKSKRSVIIFNKVLRLGDEALFFVLHFFSPINFG